MFFILILLLGAPTGHHLQGVTEAGPPLGGRRLGGLKGTVAEDKKDSCLVAECVGDGGPAGHPFHPESQFQPGWWARG